MMEMLESLKTCFDRIEAAAGKIGESVGKELSLCESEIETVKRLVLFDLAPFAYGLIADVTGELAVRGRLKTAAATGQVH